MKIIDLLNKIAKGEEVPLKIKWNGDEWNYSNGASKNYFNDYEDLFSVIDGSNLNDEVEIIEEDKKIEKITWEEKESMAGTLTEKQQLEILKRRTEKLKKNFNELIDELKNDLNKLKGKSE